MMGHDSSVADLDEVRILEDARKVLADDHVIHSTLPDLVAKVKARARNLVILRGERRVPKMMNGRLHLYSDVLSSRTRVKRLNALAESGLQRRAEPYAALAWLLGAEYPSSLLDLAWKSMLQSHAHDSIAGSGVDEIERDVTYRLRQTINISQGVARRGMEAVQRRIQTIAKAPEDVFLTVFNASLVARSEVLTVVADLPRTSGLAKFQLVEEGGKETLPVQVSTRRPHNAVINHAGDAPTMMECERVKFHFEARSIPGLGYNVYRFVPGGDFLRGGLVSGRNAMENEHLAVTINSNGSLSLVHKETNRRYDDLHYFEDGGEAGHAWMHIEPAEDLILTSLGTPALIGLEENGPLLARYRVEYRMEIPAAPDENGGDPWQRLDGSGSACRRSRETVPLTIVSHITLRKGARALEVTTRLENRAENHRLRVVLPTRLKARVCHAESAFDVVEREIIYGPGSPWHGGVNATFPMQRFVDVSDGKAGLAFISDGLREYQVTQDADRAIAITLLRAFQVSLTTVSKRWEPHPEMKLSQSPGEHEFRYWIYPHAGNWEKGGVFTEVERFTVGLEPAQAGAHAGDLPTRLSFLSVEPSQLVVTALKRSEDGKGVLLRVFNPGSKAVTGKVRAYRPLRSACYLTLEEKESGPIKVQGGQATFKAGPKQIVTLKLVVER
ncbi:MAG: hypothetical protein HUU16_12575 [Candidatus Omnitrophica bacterium]|nr:hypothetical protein [Candidatus Omnitrophota bacterium]